MSHSQSGCEFLPFIVVYPISDRQHLHFMQRELCRSMKESGNRCVAFHPPFFIGLPRERRMSGIVPLFPAMIIFRREREDLWRTSRHSFPVLESCLKPIGSAN